MKINKLHNISYGQKSSIKNNTNNDTSIDAKSTAMLFASMLALATLGKADIIEPGSSNITASVATNNFAGEKANECNEFEILTNLLSGKNTDGSEIDNWSSFFYHSDSEAAQIIQKTPVEKLLPHIRKNIYLYAENSTSSQTVINKLIEHRLNNIPKDYTPNKNFVTESGLFKEYRDDDFSSDENTKRYYLDFNFCNKIKQICKDKEQKEQFANDFIIDAYNKENISLHNNNLSKANINSAIIELLLPSE